MSEISETFVFTTKQAFKLWVRGLYVPWVALLKAIWAEVERDHRETEEFHQRMEAKYGAKRKEKWEAMRKTRA